MTKTCTAPMQTNADNRSQAKARAKHHYSAFTLTESMVVIVIVSLLAAMAQPSFFKLLRKNTFKAQVQDFVSTMQMAINAAAASNRKYEVIVDMPEQSYMLREITSTDLGSDILEDEIIVENYFNDNCWIEYVLFDDDSFVNDGRAKFRAGRTGWQYGGVIVLLDEDDNPYTVVINRISRTVVLKEGEIEPLTPKKQEEIPF